MGDLTPRSGRGLSRSGREQRAYRLVVVGGTAGAVAVVTFVLAVFNVIGFTLPVIAAIVAAICAVVFRRMITPRR
jgi:putative flippase GtrA